MTDMLVNTALGFVAGVMLFLLFEIYRRVRDIHGKVVVLPNSVEYR